MDLHQDQQPPESSQSKEDYPRSDFGSRYQGRRDRLPPDDEKSSTTHCDSTVNY